MSSWIEITNPTHGGSGWEFGTCLWSPVLNKGGTRSWELMASVEPGDLVFHLLKENHGAGYFLVGASRAAARAQMVNSQPPEPGRWVNMAPYYRIQLERFTRLSKPISIDEFLESGRDVLLNELVKNPKGQFFEQKSSGRLQVSLKYIAKAELLVEGLLTSILSAQKAVPQQVEGETFTPTENTPAYPDYTPPGTIEATVVRKIRDTQLSKNIKHKHEFRCALCGYRIFLGDGRFYAEAHHLQPLGAGHEGPDTDDNLIVLCPTHHAEFDYGVVAIDPETMVIFHQEIAHPLNGKKLAIPLAHLNRRFLEYHLKNIFKGNK